MHDAHKKWIPHGLAAALLTVIFLIWNGTATVSVSEVQVSEPLLDVRIVSEGRMTTHPDAEVTIGAEFAGVIDFLPVQEKSRVRKGDIIARIRAHDLHAALEEAKARIKEAKVDVDYYTSEAIRIGKLWKSGLGNEQDYELATYKRNAAKARRDIAEASSRRIAATLDKTIIKSPIDGIVTARWIDKGEMVDTGTPLMTIVDLTQTRVEAEVDEFDAGRVRIGDKVTISADGYPEINWPAHVSEIPDAVSERKLRPSDPALPFDSRVLMVKIEMNEECPLVLGQRVNVEILSSKESLSNN